MVSVIADKLESDANELVVSTFSSVENVAGPLWPAELWVIEAEDLVDSDFEVSKTDSGVDWVVICMGMVNFFPTVVNTTTELLLVSRGIKVDILASGSVWEFIEDFNVVSDEENL